MTAAALRVEGRWLCRCEECLPTRGDWVGRGSGWGSPRQPTLRWMGLRPTPPVSELAYLNCCGIPGKKLLYSYGRGVPVIRRWDWQSLDVSNQRTKSEGWYSKVSRKWTRTSSADLPVRICHPPRPSCHYEFEVFVCVDHALCYLSVAYLRGNLSTSVAPARRSSFEARYRG